MSDHETTVDQLDQARRQMEHEILRSALYSRRACVRDGVLVLEGGHAEEWTERISRWNQVSPSRGYSPAAHCWQEILVKRRYMPQITGPHSGEGRR